MFGDAVLKIIDSALKHGFTEEELREIWKTVPEESVVRIRHEKLPPHYMMIGFTKGGARVELIAYTEGRDWCLFHAYMPTTPGFKREYKKNGGVI